MKRGEAIEYDDSHYARLADLLRSRVEPDTNGGCWLWAYGTGGHGYVQITFERQVYLGHRAAYRVFKGPIPDGLSVLHKCDVRQCINPDHLYAGTQLENMNDVRMRNRKGATPYKDTYKPAKGIKALRLKLAEQGKDVVRLVMSAEDVETLKEMARKRGMGAARLMELLVRQEKARAALQ